MNDKHSVFGLGGTMEPVNHTFILIGWWNQETGESDTRREDVFYKDCPNYEHMPEVTQGPETEAEHAEWWAWYKQQGE